MKSIFVHIPKNAGSAIKNDPSFRDKFDVLTGRHLPKHYFYQLRDHMKARKEDVSEGHCRWRDTKKSVRVEYRPFAVVRNPWSRVVSRWTFYQKVRIEKPRYKHMYKARTFEDFLSERHKWGEEPYYWHKACRGWYDQADYVTGENGRLKVECLRFECLNQDMQRYFNIDKPVQYKNVSNGDMRADRSGIDGRRSYREYYTNKTIQIIADWHARDIEFFGFDFDSGAKRNLWIPLNL